MAVVLLATWMGARNGGYFVGDWALVAFAFAGVALVMAMVGRFGGAQSWWGATATGLFLAFTAWTFASVFWAPNRGEAWVGAGQTALYLLAFWAPLCLLTSGASRRWILVASALGPAGVSVFTLLTITSRVQDLFVNNRFFGSVGYYNGEAAFVLVPFWVSIYLGGSRRVHPIIRGLALGGVVLGLGIAVLTQSRGAMVAMVASVPVFFAFSGQRLRGLLALAPVAGALLLSFDELNGVYQTFLADGSPEYALSLALPVLWRSATVAAVYGLLWGVIDGYWRPPAIAVRVAGGLALVAVAALLIFGAAAAYERVGNPVAYGQQKWEAFKTDDTTGQEQSRYLSASGSGRYLLWKVAWEDFVSHPLLGVGTRNYEATYYQLREEAVVPFSRTAHMLPLEVLAERGLVGGVLFFGFLVTCVASGLWHRFKSLNAEGKGQVGALVAALAYWFVHSSAEWFWQLPAVTLPAIVYLAILAAPWDRSPAPRFSWPYRVNGAAVALLTIIVVAPLYVADRYEAQARTYETENPWLSLDYTERAQRWNPVEPMLAQREAEYALKVGDWPRAEAAYKRAVELNPEYYVPHYLLGLLYQELGERESAIDQYKKALSLNPKGEAIQERLEQLEGRGADRAPADAGGG